MDIRFYIDESGDPHIWRHNVTEDEVREALARTLDEHHGRGTSTVAYGQTGSGRYLKIIYSTESGPDDIFVITAFDLPPKQVRALKQRQRRKRR